MIIDLSNYRLKEDICAVTGDTDTETPVIKLSDLLIGGKYIGILMKNTTAGKPEYNENATPGVQCCCYKLLPEEIGLTSYYEIYQALLQAFGTTEEELSANDGYMEFPISSIKLGDAVFNATSAWIDLSARYLEAQIVGQTFTINLQVSFLNPNLVLAGVAGGGTFEESFEVDIMR